MTISVNTDTMNEIAALAARISSELTEANQCMFSITEHNDWNCVERDKINEIIFNLKKCAEQLKDCADDYSAVVRKSAASFDEFEKTNPNYLQDMHSALANALKIETPIKKEFTALVPLKDIINQIIGPGGVHPRFRNPILPYVFNNLDQQIKVVNYK